MYRTVMDSLKRKADIEPSGRGTAAVFCMAPTSPPTIPSFTTYPHTTTLCRVCAHHLLHHHCLTRTAPPPHHTTPAFGPPRPHCLPICLTRSSACHHLSPAFLLLPATLALPTSHRHRFLLLAPLNTSMRARSAAPLVRASPPCLHLCLCLPRLRTSSTALPHSCHAPAPLPHSRIAAAFATLYRRLLSAATSALFLPPLVYAYACRAPFYTAPYARFWADKPSGEEESSCAVLHWMRRTSIAYAHKISQLFAYNVLRAGA